MDAYCQLPRQCTQQEKKPELVTFAVKYTNPIDTASTEGSGIQKPQQCLFFRNPAAHKERVIKV